MGKKIEGRLKKKAHIGQNSVTFAAGNSQNVNACLAVESKDKYDVCKREERKKLGQCNYDYESAS